MRQIRFSRQFLFLFGLFWFLAVRVAAFDMPIDALRVVALGTDGHVYEYLATAYGWSQQRLTFADNERGIGDLANYPFGSGVIYRGVDNNLHLLVHDGVRWAHQTPETRSAVTSTPVAYYYGGLHIIYRGIDNNIYEVVHSTSGWDTYQLTFDGRARGNPHAYVHGTQHILYRDVEGYLQELVFDESTLAWRSNQLAANVLGDPVSYEYGTQHIIYHGTDNNLHELVFNGSGWDAYQLTSTGLMASNPTAYQYGTQHIVFRNQQSRIVELVFNHEEGQWDRFEIANGASVGSPSVFVGQTQTVLFRSQTDRIELLFFDGSQWQQSYISAQNGIKFSSDPIAFPYVKTAQTGAYFSGHYRNLFYERLRKSPEQISAKLDAAWSQLFYGADSERVYYPVGDDSAYILDVHHNDIRTEGMSYGMMIAVQMDKKEEFDRLWTWSKQVMQHQSGQYAGYFIWHVDVNGNPIDNQMNPAPDGETWFVTALMFAAARWGNGSGIYNYEAEANIILDAMLRREPPMFNLEEQLVVFVPADWGNELTNPSYQTPHFYELWARWGQQDNMFWCETVDSSRHFSQQAVQYPETGLVSNYTSFDGKPKEFKQGDGHADFRHDAWRFGMNMALDYSWFAADAWQSTQSEQLLTFFASHGPNYPDLYTVDGMPLSTAQNTGLVAMNAVAALAAETETGDPFVQALWDASIPIDQGRYYNGMLYMLGLLATSGNFQIYHLDPVTYCQESIYIPITTRW